MTFPSRSGLRAIDIGYAGRQRRYLLRAVVVGTVVFCVFALVWAIASRAFATDGIGALVYWLHDAFYLPLKGWAWTQWFPYVLVWLIPLTVVVAAVSAEYLTQFGPIRRLHRRIILAISERSWAQRFLGAPLKGRDIERDVWLASLTGHDAVTSRPYGFARRVVRRAQEDLWMKIAVGLASGKPPSDHDATRLVRLSDMRLRLDPSDAPAHLCAVEVVTALSDKQNSRDLHQTMADFLTRQSDKDLVGPLVTALSRLDGLPQQKKGEATERLYEIATGFGAFTSAPNGPEPIWWLAFACDALAAFALSWSHDLPEVRGFQRAWVAARVGETPDGVSAALAQAESHIFFEMWSELAEVVPDNDGYEGLMMKAMNDQGARNLALVENAETFAWKGTRS